MTFVDNDPAFYLADGSINDGYLTTDGVHLTRAATEKLCKNLGLKLKEGVKGVHRNMKHQRNQHMSHQNRDVQNRDVQPPRPVQTSHVNQTNDELSHTFWTNARQKATRSSHIHDMSNRNDDRSS